MGPEHGSTPSRLFAAAFEHGVLSAQWTFSIIFCFSSLFPSYFFKKKALCSKMLMVFKPVTCPDIFTRAYLYAAVRCRAAAKLGITCPCIPRTL